MWYERKENINNEEEEWLYFKYSMRSCSDKRCLKIIEIKIFNNSLEQFISSSGGLQQEVRGLLWYSRVWNILLI